MFSLFKSNRSVELVPKAWEVTIRSNWRGNTSFLVQVAKFGCLGYCEFGSNDKVTNSDAKNDFNSARFAR